MKHVMEVELQTSPTISAPSLCLSTTEDHRPNIIVCTSKGLLHKYVLHCMSLKGATILPQYEYNWPQIPDRKK